MGEETEKLLSSANPPPPVSVNTESVPTEGTAASAVPLQPEEKGPAEKVIEEAPTTSEEQEEKLAAVVENAEEKTVLENRELIPPLDEETAAVPFVEESYYVKDLKDSEKKALQEFKSKIADAIKHNTFLVPSSKTATAGPSRDVNIVKEGEEGKKDDGTIEEKALAVAEKEAKDEGEEEKTDSVKAASTEEEERRRAGTEVETEGKKVKAEEHVPSVAKDDPSTIGTAFPTATETPQTTAPDTHGPETALPLEVASVSAAEEEKTMVPSTIDVEPLQSQDRDASVEPEEESPSLEDLSLWGVPLLHSKGDERTDVVLLKFLRARDFKVNDAMSMIKDTMLWRKDFKADDLIAEEVSTEFDSVAYMYGVDKEGHPVCYNHYGVFQDKELYQKTFGDEAQFQKFLRWRIQVLENGMQRLDFRPSGVHSMVQVTDLKESPGFVKRRNITKKALAILQDNYPELVAKQIFVNVPWYFGALYSLHGKFITARSKSKVVLVRPEKVTETLFKYIPVENLPVKYGGFGRVSDNDFEGVEAPVQELVIKPGETQVIELPEQEVGSTAVWDVVVVGWDVLYGEEFVPSGEGKYTVVIQKPKKLTAAEEPLRNSFKATTDAGKVTITIENTSKKKKLVDYRYAIKQQQSSGS